MSLQEASRYFKSYRHLDNKNGISKAPDFKRKYNRKEPQIYAIPILLPSKSMLLLNKSSNRTYIYFSSSYDFPSCRTNNICNDFFIFRCFISLELFLEIAFVSIHGHFTFVQSRWEITLKEFIFQKVLARAMVK